MKLRSLSWDPVPPLALCLTLKGYIKNVGPLAVDDGQVEAELNRVLRPLEQPAGLPHHQVEYKIPRLVNDYLQPPKVTSKMAIGLEYFLRARGELDQMGARDPHELMRANEVHFIRDCAGMAASASLYRKESRWGLYHYHVRWTARPTQSRCKFLISCVRAMMTDQVDTVETLRAELRSADLVVRRQAIMDLDERLDESLLPELLLTLLDEDPLLRRRWHRQCVGGSYRFTGTKPKRPAGQAYFGSLWIGRPRHVVARSAATWLGRKRSSW